MTRPVRRSLGIIAVLAVIFSIGDAALAMRNTQRLFRTANEVTHTHAVLEALDELLSTVKDAETGQRGFVITGSTEYLRPYYIAEGTIASWMTQIDTLTRASPAQQAQIPDLRRRVAEKLDELRETIALRQNEGFAAAERLVTTGRGRVIMDSLRSQVDAMVREENSQLAERIAMATRSRDVAVSSLVLAAVLELLTLAAAAILLQRSLRHRTIAENALARHERWYRTTLESIGDAVVTTDTAGNVTTLNPVAERLTGWPSAEAHGLPLEAVFRIIGEQTRLAMPSPTMRALAEGVITGLDGDTLLVARDGTELPIDDSAAPIRDEHHRIIGAVLVFRDVTRWRDAERRLIEADHHKDEFLAVLAHELRNPLAPLRNALEILRLYPEDPAAIERVGGIMERQLQQMVRLIDDLLDVSRVTRNRLDLQLEALDVASVVHAAVEAAGPQIRQAGHTLKLTLPPAPVYIEADRTRLTQALSNLLNNAIKYTPPGGRIWLIVDHQGGDVIVAVRDTGVGIRRDMLESIFAMFVQADRSLERSQGGLGIGLPLVRRIVELHHGEVHAQSAGPGRGSEFVIRLPVMVAPVEASPPPTVVHATQHPRRILIADDNVDAGESLAMLLRIMGHEVAVTHDGVEALAQVESFRPDFALLDIGMPRLNGYDTAERIRTSERGRAIELVALTGWGQDDDRKRSKAAGFDHHMVKPVELAALEQLLNRDDAAAR